MYIRSGIKQNRKSTNKERLTKRNVRLLVELETSGSKGELEPYVHVAQRAAERTGSS